MSVIKIEHLRKEYDGRTVLKDICTEINTGDVISLIGPRGTGKSTFMRCLNLLETPDSGTVTVDGETAGSASELRRKIGMVFDSPSLFENLSVIDNITAAPVKLLGYPVDRAYEEGMELLGKTGLAEKADSFPYELNGSQKQRAAIARAAAMHPGMILFDEPTLLLDHTMTDEVLSVIRNFARDKMTMMIATDEMKFAREVSTRVFYLDEGIIYEEGTPKKIFENPSKEKTRIFIKRLKRLELETDSHDFDHIGFIGKIEKFGRDNGISPAVIMDLELAFEELISQNIMAFFNYNEAGKPINVRMEYSETLGTSEMTISFAGEPYDPFTEGDVFSVNMIKKMADSVNYGYVDGRNIVRVSFSA